MENTFVEESSGNVYADLGMKDAEDMLRKARLVSSIQDIIDERNWTQRQAAKVLGMTQPKLSLMLRGQFHGISETKMLDYLTRLGSDVQIVVSHPTGQSTRQGSIQVVFA